METEFFGLADVLLRTVGFHLEVKLSFADHPRTKTPMVAVRFGGKTVLTTVSRDQVFRYFEVHGLSDANAANLVAEIMTDCHRVINRQTRRERILKDVVFV